MEKKLDSLLKKVSGLGEEKLQKLIQELMNNEKIVITLMKVMQKTQEAKQTLDKNVQGALELINVPSKDDYNEIKKEITDISKKVNTLELKIDKLAKSLETKKEPVKKTTAKKATTKKTPAKKTVAKKGTKK